MGERLRLSIGNIISTADLRAESLFLLFWFDVTLSSNAMWGWIQYDTV